MPSYVYKYVLNKEIIYIGKTDVDLARRLFQHGKSGDNIPEEAWDEINNSDIYYAECANSSMSDTIESALINKYKPKYNVAKQNQWEGMYFIEPLWYIYKSEDTALIKGYKKQIKELHDKLSDIDRNKEIDFRCAVERERKRIIDDQRQHCEKCAYIHKKYDLDKGVIYNFSNTISDDEAKQNGRTYEQIIDLYRQNTEWIDYESKSFDAFGNLEVIKKIHTDSFGFLYFHFKSSNGGEVSGHILSRPDSKTINNHIVLRQWMNRGSYMYYPKSITKFSVI